MKKPFLLFLLILPIFTFWACKDKPASVNPDTMAAEKQTEQKSTVPASTGAAAPAPVNTGAPAPANTGATKGGVNLKTQVVAVQKAVLEFRTKNKRFPSSLEELKKSAQLDFDISKYNYDPQHGRVTLKQ